MRRTAVIERDMVQRTGPRFLNLACLPEQVFMKAEAHPAFMHGPRLRRALTSVPPLPKDALEAAASVLASGHLFRYGEHAAEGTWVARLEQAFAEHLGARFAVAVNSGGSAIHLAMRSLGVGSGDVVAMNAFTLAPVPGAVEHLGASVALVDIDEDLRCDLEDLKRCFVEQQPTAFLLSHMRGHVADMDAIVALCTAHDVALIEDCAHTLGATYDGRPTGRFGVAGCFSLQTWKQINAGEGGILVTDDEDLAARAILASGAYMLHAQHGTPPPEDVVQRWAASTPNLSMRLNEVAAAVALPQLATLEERNARWRAIHDRLASGLANLPGLRLPVALPQVLPAPTSLQFVADLPAEVLQASLDACAARGVPIKWFGRDRPVGFTSTHRNWGYVPSRSLPKGDGVLAGLCDVRLPADLSDEDVDTIVAVVRLAFGH